MMKNAIQLLALLLLSFISRAEDIGINFREDLSWEEIKTLAAKEKKLIFIDFYTSYCIPCKIMEKDVFSSPEIGKFMNDRFISIKLQLDSTKKDKEFVNNWRTMAKEFAKKFGVVAYPTYVFIDADGDAVHKASSLCSTSEFMEIARKALSPETGYFQNRKRYENGERSPELLLKLVRSAEDLMEKDVEKLASEYLEKETNRLTANWLKIAQKYTKHTSDPSFVFIMKHEAEVNRILGKGEAERICFPAIYEEANAAARTAGRDTAAYWQKFDAVLKQKYKSRANEILAFSRAYHKPTSTFESTSFYLNNYQATISDNTKMDLCAEVYYKTPPANQLQAIETMVASVTKNTANCEHMFIHAQMLQALGKNDAAIQQMDVALGVAAERYRQIFLQYMSELVFNIQASDYLEIGLQKGEYSKVVLNKLATETTGSANIDNELSSRLYKGFLNRLDPKKEFFREEDFALLKKYEYQLDEEWKIGTMSFCDEVKYLYFKRLKEAKSRLTAAESAQKDIQGKLKLCENEDFFRGYVNEFVRQVNPNAIPLIPEFVQKKQG